MCWLSSLYSHPSCVCVHFPQPVIKVYFSVFLFLLHSDNICPLAYAICQPLSAFPPLTSLCISIKDWHWPTWCLCLNKFKKILLLLQVNVFRSHSPSLPSAIVSCVNIVFSLVFHISIFLTFCHSLFLWLFPTLFLCLYFLSLSLFFSLLSPLLLSLCQCLYPSFPHSPSSSLLFSLSYCLYPFMSTFLTLDFFLCISVSFWVSLCLCFCPFCLCRNIFVSHLCQCCYLRVPSHRLGLNVLNESELEVICMFLYIFHADLPFSPVILCW